MYVHGGLKSRIKKIAPKEWHFIAKRTNAPPQTVWLKFPFNEFLSRKIYNTKLDWVAFWHKPYAEFYLHSEEVRTAIESVTKLLFSFEKAEKHIEKVEFLSNKAKEKAKFFVEKNLKTLSNKELLRKFNEVIQAYSKAFIHGFVVWCSSIMQEEALKIIKKHKKTLKGLGLDEKTAFSILLISEKKSIYTKKEEELDKLAAKYKNSIQKIRPGEIKKKIPELHKEIIQFLDIYRWVGYDYGGPEITYKEIAEIIAEREKKKENRITKKEIIKKCSFTTSEKKVFEILSGISFIKDARNICDDFVHFSLDFFYTEVGRRYNLTKEEVRYLWQEELENLLKNKERYSKKYLRKKMKFCAARTNPLEGLSKYYVGEEARQFIEKELKIKIEEEVKEVNEIKGITASPGKTSGKVKIVKVLKDSKKLQKGEVLVTHMTSPRFMSAIGRCSAIITDEGGMASHAAIVARELGKPCIVGTKIATKVFKDGDLVEVDADKGVVRKIE